MEPTLHSLVIESCTSNQSNTAVLYDDGSTKQSLTYQELLNISSKLMVYFADYLKPGDLIGLCLKYDQFIPPILLSILRCDGAFYNMDVDSAAFACQVLENVGIKYILLHKDYFKTFKEALASKHRLTELPKCCLDAYRMYRIETILQRAHNPDMAYYITTSGTTGSPKVVQVPHSCIVPNITHLRQIFNISTSDLVLMASPLTFDPSLVELFMTLTSGACLLMLPRATFMNPDLLLHTVYERNGVTIMQITPTLLTRFNVDKLPHTLLGDLSPLRVLALGGEQFPSLDFMKKSKSPLNTTSLYNLYGTTEVSCWATCSQVQIEEYGPDDSVPIGDCLKDTYVEVRDEAGGVMSEGKGELFIGGFCRQCILSSDEMGSLNMNVMKISGTGDIVDKRQNGQIYHLRRKDRQVKRNGKRVNLDEIKEAVHKVDGIHQCEVLLLSNKIVLFIVPDKLDEIEQATPISVETETLANKPNSSRNYRSKLSVIEEGNPNSSDDEVEDMRKQLASKLPHHSLPDVVLHVDDLPMTKHGKVDMKKLEESYNYEILQKVCVDPLNCLQQSWKNLIGSKADINEQSNFISMGGNSLKALHLMNELEKVLGKSLPDLLHIILQKTYHDIKQFILKEQNLALTNVDKQDKTESVIQSKSANSYTGDDSIENHSIETSRVECRKDLSAYEIHRHLEPSSTQPSILNKTDEVRENVEDMKNKRKLSENFKHNKAFKVESKFYMTISRGSKSTYLKKGFNCCLAGYAEELSQETALLKRRLKLCEKWKYDTRKCVDASPLLAISRSHDESIVYIGSHSHTMCAIKLETGEQLWETTLPDRIESSACLTLCGQFVVIGCYDNRVYCLHSNSGEIWWSHDTGGQVKSSPSVDEENGHIYIGSHSHILFCLNVQERTVVWKVCLQAGSIVSTPCVWYWPHSVYVGTLGGKIFSIEALSGDIQWQVSLGKPVFSSLAACRAGVAVSCTDNTLYFYSHQGQKIWQFSTNGPIFSSPVIFSHCTIINITKFPSSSDSTQPEVEKLINIGSDNDDEFVVFGCHDSHVYCLNLMGDLVWKVKANSMVYASPFISTIGLQKFRTDLTKDEIGADMSNSMSVIVFCLSTGTVYMVHAMSGDILCERDLPSEIFSSPVFHDSTIVVGCRDNYVYSLTLGRETEVQPYACS